MICGARAPSVDDPALRMAGPIMCASRPMQGGQSRHGACAQARPFLVNAACALPALSPVEDTTSFAPTRCWQPAPCSRPFLLHPWRREDALQRAQQTRRHCCTQQISVCAQASHDWTWCCFELSQNTTHRRLRINLVAFLSSENQVALGFWSCGIQIANKDVGQ